PQVMPTAERADPRHLDRFDAEVAELRDIRGPEVERDLPIRTAAEVRALAARADDLRPSLIDRVAARTDRRSDRCDEGRRARARAHARADEGLRDAQAPP